ncbi:MAG TPA: fluoride efflux transporter CrcB [Limnochordia bacterium]
MSRYLWIGCGGFLGAVARYWLGTYISSRVPAAFPLGTFVVNVSGSLLLGCVASAGIDAGLIPPRLCTALSVGFLGGYTTFSSWHLETMRLMEAGRFWLATTNALGGLAAGMCGLWIGLSLGRLLVSVGETVIGWD